MLRPILSPVDSSFAAEEAAAAMSGARNMSGAQVTGISASPWALATGDPELLYLLLDLVQNSRLFRISCCIGLVGSRHTSKRALAPRSTRSTPTSGCSPPPPVLYVTIIPYIPVGMKNSLFVCVRNLLARYRSWNSCPIPTAGLHPETDGRGDHDDVKAWGEMRLERRRFLRGWVHMLTRSPGASIPERHWERIAGKGNI